MIRKYSTIIKCVLLLFHISFCLNFLIWKYKVQVKPEPGTIQAIRQKYRHLQVNVFKDDI